MARFLGYLFFFLLISSSATACDRCVLQSKAAYYYDDSSSSSARGACGYGNLTLELSKGYFAAAVPSLYKKGAGCGACYQIRCKNGGLCSAVGAKVVLTDQNDNNKTDFVLSQKAFSAMALKGKGQQLLKVGIVDVEYKRIPCAYRNKNLSVRVEESSNPYYLAIKFLYQGGQTEIVAVDVAPVGSSNWGFLSRNYGAVWDTKRVPQGALQLRMVVTSGYDGKWVWAKSVLPADWKSGVIYDAGVQIDDVAKEGCPARQCGEGPWK